MEFAAALPAALLCRACRAVPPPFDRAVAWGIYQDELRQLLHLLKYEGMQPIARRLGTLVAESILIAKDWPDDLVVVPVPLFARKRRQRGFNQAELVARSATTALSRGRAKIRVRLAAGLLERQRSTESQAGLSPHQRRVNVRGAFFVPQPERVAGQHVLLIDDIYTTGATARACSQALRRAGAKSVWVATVARAQKELVSAPHVPRPEQGAEAEVPMEQDVAFWGQGSVAR